MKEFNTIGTITFDFSIDVEALTEEEAEAKALEIVKNYYHLSVTGAYHQKDEIKIKHLDTGVSRNIQTEF
jgi:hypothetical protein